MHAANVLYYGHCTFLDAVKAVPERDWDQTGVCGEWSVRNLIAHIASYELVLCDVLASLSGEDAPAPNFDEFVKPGAHFNDTQVALRQNWSAEATLNEYNAAHDRATTLAKAIPAERWAETGTIPWYGAEYSLDDLVVYMYYGHKREHSAQIAAFCDRLSRDEAAA